MSRPVQHPWLVLEIYHPQKQAQAWSLNNWITESHARTQQWRAGQYNAPVAWIWNEGRSIPRDAIQGGEERGQPLYICRAYYEVRACRLVVHSAADFTIHMVTRADSVSFSLTSCKRNAH